MSINLTPYTIYKRSGLPSPKPSRIGIQLADKNIIRPKGVIEEVLVKVEHDEICSEKFVFPVDFVVMDMPEDYAMPIILGRPFLNTSRGLIVVVEKEVVICCFGVELHFNMADRIKQPVEYKPIILIDAVKDFIQQWMNASYPSLTLARCLASFE